MHILITAVGKRTEHWTELFAALADKPDIADRAPLKESTR
jgi:hypothetical protein